MLGPNPSITLTHGAGNTTITLTGSNFLAGIAATWNGAYRSTTYVNANQIKVAIPAADLTSIGSATVTIANPGSVTSTAVSVTIN